MIKKETASLKGGLTLGITVGAYDGREQRRRERELAKSLDADLYGEGLLGESLGDKAKNTLSERFLVPPFSVMNAREGFWQERKRAWIALGIQSELGRGEDLLGPEGTPDRQKKYKEETASFKSQGKLSALMKDKNKASTLARTPNATPGGSNLPAMNYKDRQRGTGSGKAIAGTEAKAQTQPFKLTVTVTEPTVPVRIPEEQAVIDTDDPDRPHLPAFLLAVDPATAEAAPVVAPAPSKAKAAPKPATSGFTMPTITIAAPAAPKAPARARSAAVSTPIAPPACTWVAPTEMPRLQGAARIGIDVETYDPDLDTLGPGVRRGSYIVGISVARDDGGKWYLPMRHEGGGNLDPDQVLNWARSELNAFDGEVVGAKIDYDMDHLFEVGVTFPKAKRWRDVQIAEPLLDENRLAYGLEVLGQEYLGLGKNEALLKEAATAYGFGTTNKEIKKNLWRLPAGYVGPYAEDDADLPMRILPLQEAKLAAEDLTDLFDLESRLTPILLAMRRRGVRVDLSKVERVGKMLDLEIAKWLGVVRRYTGSGGELMAAESLAPALEARGLAVARTPKTNKPSIAKNFFAKYKGDPLVDAIAAGRRVNTLKTMFVDGHIEGHVINGRIHCNYNQLKSDDGGTIARLCVDGDTVLNLKSGPVKIKDFRLSGNDFIRTHNGRWRRILNKFYKGRETMYKITLSNGESLTATAGHRVLTAGGWMAFGDLQVNQEVVSYVGILGAGERSRDHCSIGGHVQVHRKPDYGTDRGQNEYRTFYGSGSPQMQYPEGRVSFAQAVALCAEQVRCQESYDRKNRGQASQLYRAGGGRQGLFAAKERQGLFLRPQSNHDGFPWIKSAPGRGDRPSYRQEQKEQRVRQFGVDDSSGAREAASNDATIGQVRSIACIEKVGNRDVWDIEVEEDHSYIAGGFVNHNSADSPNLQNIPSRKNDMVDDDLNLGEDVVKLIRGMFIPEEGEQWERHDLSQIEYRYLTHFAVGNGAEEARAKYNNDPKTDYHKMCAVIAKVDPEDTQKRKLIKGANFLVVYGGGTGRLASVLNIDDSAATTFMADYNRELPFVRATLDKASESAAKHGYALTILKRRGRFDLWEPTGYGHGKPPLPKDKAVAAYGTNIKRYRTYAALSRKLQGSAADHLKKGLVDIWESGVCDVIGAPLITVHDENDWSRDNSPAHLEAAAEARRLLEQAITLKVPVTAAADVGADWGATS